MAETRTRETLHHYLSERDFGLTMLAVLGLHILAFGVYAMWPRTTVEEIPVRTLNIRLGIESDAMAAKVDPKTGSVPLPSLESVALDDTSVKTNVSQKKNVSPPTPKAANGASFRSFTEFVADKSKERAANKAVPKQKTRVPAKTSLPEIKPPKQAEKKPETNTGTPRQYVRAHSEVSAPVTSGNPAGATDTESIMLRYEQKISAWLQRHKTYPSIARQLGQHGTPIVRIRIDRQGNVKFSSIDQSTGYQMIDRAALDMVKRANPLPAAPAGYPGGKLLEFKIPVTFKLH